MREAIRSLLRGIASLHLFPPDKPVPAKSNVEAFREDMEALRGDWERAESKTLAAVQREEPE